MLTIVAEISGNHGGAEEAAHHLIDDAKRVGADAVKLQTFEPKALVGDPRFAVEHGPWKGRNLVELYQETWTPKTWHKALFAHARRIGLDIFSSPFSREDVDFLEGLDCSRYKIASFEILDLDLIRYAAQTKKPLIISTGMATLAEVEEAVEEALASGCRDLTVLKCTSGYPTPNHEAHIATLADLRAYFNGPNQRVKVGLSDHTGGLCAAAAAVALGAELIEAHLKLGPEEETPDAGFSLDPEDFEELVGICFGVYEAIGQVHYGPSPSERAQVPLRRALWVVRNVKAGEPFTRDNLQSRRPSLGAPHYPIETFLGKRAKVDIKAFTLLNQDWAE